MHNDGENFTLNNLSDKFPTTSVQFAADCFLRGMTLNQFDAYFYFNAIRELSRGSDPTYSLINLLNTNEDDNALDELPDDGKEITDDDEGNLICEIKSKADNYRLCKAKAAHEDVMGKIDASLTRKTLTAAEAPQLDTKASITKPDDVVKTVYLDVFTILGEPLNDPVFSTVRSWLRTEISPEAKSPEIQQSKGLLRYCQEPKRRLIQDEGQLLCYKEPSDKLEDDSLRICLTLSLSLACFRLGYHNEKNDYMRAFKT